tara:strand:- start:49 stop:219 length:171 start_codon:yes stop_codon:yes gene_type:complete
MATHKNYIGLGIAAERFHTVVVVGMIVPFGTVAGKIVGTVVGKKNNCSGFHKNFHP